MRLLFSFGFLSLTLMFTGCGTNKSEFGPKKRCATTTAGLIAEGPGPIIAGSGNRGLLLTTVRDYKSSRLFFYDFASGKTSQLMSGESGDPGLFSSSGEVFFFNRSTADSNLRSIGIGEGNFDLGVQTAIPGAGAGDPQAIHHLDDRFLLMSFWATHLLGIFDLEECTLVKTVQLHFDTGPNDENVFRPSTIFSAETNGSKEIYVLHQGIDSDGIKLNGTQQIFVLNWNGTDLTGTNIKPDNEKIAGIPLQVSNPTAVFMNSAGVPVVAGSCTLFNGADCKAGFETIDLAARTTALTFDTSALPEKNNGAMVAAGESAYFAQMAIPDADSTVGGSEKIIAKIDLSTKTVTRVHTYPAESFGCCGLFYDETSKKLLITDHTATDGGSIVVMDESGILSEKIPVENTPYAGLIIP